MASTSATAGTKVADIPVLLRFLTQSASVPLSEAMRLIPALQRANLTTTATIASAPLSDIRTLLFPEDQKAAKQLHNAAKRASGGGKRKKAGDAPEGGAAGSRKRRKSPTGEGEEQTSAEAEAELVLPDVEDVDHTTLCSTVLFTNRAPLLLAFTVVLLKYTMPEQPLSSRLSLAQAMVSTGARSRAITLGLEKSSAEEEGWGKGQPSVRVMGKDVKVLRRWGYEVTETVDDSKTRDRSTSDIASSIAKVDADKTSGGEKTEEDHTRPEPTEPPLWGLDLEALKKSNAPPLINAPSRSNTSGLPIYTPQSARTYVLKSFATANTESTKTGTKKDVQEKARNLGLLLAALELLYQSWSSTLSKADLDRRAWSWYVAVRPEVEDGVRGWGGKGEVKLERILDLRRKADT